MAARIKSLSPLTMSGAAQVLSSSGPYPACLKLFLSCPTTNTAPVAVSSNPSMAVGQGILVFPGTTIEVNPGTDVLGLEEHYARGTAGNVLHVSYLERS